MTQPESLTKEDQETLDTISGEAGRRAYPDDYLKEICAKIGGKNEDKNKLFSQRVRYAGGRYLDLKRMNKGRIRPHAQSVILERYRKALEQARKSYLEIQKNTAVSGRLGKAVRKRFEQTEEQAMKDMFHPYCTDSGMAITLFERFLGELIHAAEDAQLQDMDNYKVDLSGVFLTEWIAIIGKYWPENGSISFMLGKYDKEESIYTSPSIPIVHSIIRRIEPAITEKEITNSMRKIRSESLLYQPVANFFLV